MRACALFLLVIVLNTPTVLAQEDERSIETKIAALEHSWKTQAYQAKDLRTLDDLLDPLFVAVNEDGRILNKTEFPEQVDATHPSPCAIEMVDVRVHGSTAIATALYTEIRVRSGQLLMSKRRFVDTWTEKGGRWFGLAALTLEADASH